MKIINTNSAPAAIGPYVQAVDIGNMVFASGRGHATDTAIIMGLAGYLPDNVDIDNIPVFIETVKNTKKLSIAIGTAEVDFDFDKVINFLKFRN